MSGFAWPCYYFFTLPLAHLRAATFGACVEGWTEPYMLVQALTSKAGIAIPWHWCWRQASRAAGVWGRGSPWDHHRGVQWCWETHVLHTDEMLPSCTQDVPPLLPSDTQQGNDTVPEHLLPCLLPETQPAAVHGLLSLPAYLLVLFNICLTILTEAQDKDQLSKQQKWCCKLFPCPGMLCEQWGPMGGMDAMHQECHGPSECGVSWRHCQTPCSATSSKENVASNLSFVVS